MGTALLKRERKVKNHTLKKTIRNGTKTLPKRVSSYQREGSLSIKNILPLDSIICADALKTLKKMSNHSVDIIITSPPYNFGLNYSKDDDTKKWTDYFAWLYPIWKECFRVLKVGGRMCVNVQPLFSDYMPTHQIIASQLRKLGFLFKAEILWEKNNYNAKYTAWGSWKSPSMPYMKYTWEFIEIFVKGSQKKTGSREDIDIKADEFKKWVYGKWTFAPESRMKKFDHPAMFPEELPYRLLKLYSYQNDIVLDPFNGVGTTTLMAAKLNRRYIGIDLSKKYCTMARRRIMEYTRQTKMRI